jgi:hypothetical protein
MPPFNLPLKEYGTLYGALMGFLVAGIFKKEQ